MNNKKESENNIMAEIKDNKTGKNIKKQKYIAKFKELEILSSNKMTCRKYMDNYVSENTIIQKKLSMKRKATVEMMKIVKKEKKV